MAESKQCDKINMANNQQIKLAYQDRLNKMAEWIRESSMNAEIKTLLESKKTGICVFNACDFEGLLSTAKCHLPHRIWIEFDDL